MPPRHIEGDGDGFTIGHASLHIKLRLLTTSRLSFGLRRQRKYRRKGWPRAALRRLLGGKHQVL